MDLLMVRNIQTHGSNTVVVACHSLAASGVVSLTFTYDVTHDSGTKVNLDVSTHILPINKKIHPVKLPGSTKDNEN